jgi:glycosyltransferase involved in cell wall biosynthesis
VRIAVILANVPTGGGAFQQSLSTVEMLARKGATKHEILVFTPFELTCQLLKSLDIDAIRFEDRVIRHVDMLSSTIAGGVICRFVRHLGFRRIGRHLDAILAHYNIDLVLLTDVTELSLRIGDHPFITTVMDLDHIDHPEYREHFTDRVFEHRERVLCSTLTRSVAVIANCPSEASRIAHLYHVDPKRIVELPFLPSLVVRRRVEEDASVTDTAIRRKYNLPSTYLFYPAYYISHKNHLYLLKGLAELERRHSIILHAVFCGADPRGEKATVERQAHALGLADRTHFLDLVPDQEIPVLYDGAFAVASPSPFGPTNLQQLEAAALGCPVVCSDLTGCREQMGDAALYCDLSNPSSLADQLAALIRDPALVRRLQDAARKLITDLNKTNYGDRLSQVFDDFAYLRRRWAWPEDHV